MYEYVVILSDRLQLCYAISSALQRWILEHSAYSSRSSKVRSGLVWQLLQCLCLCLLQLAVLL